MNKIPKKIHYCWYSGEAKDEKTQRCIDSWHKNLPDYEIMEWNTSNCDMEENEYVKTAHNAGKWAQIADYFRLKILYENGGIYLDADVLVNDSFDELLEYNAFFPIEDYYWVINAVIGAVAGCEAISKMMKPYINADKYEGFEQTLDSMHYMTEVLSNDYGFVNTGFTQVLQDNIAVLSPNILLINIDDGNNICEHLYAGTWLDKDRKYRKGASYKNQVLKMYFYNLFGRPDTGTDNKASEVVYESILLSEEIKQLIPTVQKGLEYLKENPDSGKLLFVDISEAINAIANELKIEPPQISENIEEAITACENWLRQLEKEITGKRRF